MEHNQVVAGEQTIAVFRNDFAAAVFAVDRAGLSYFFDFFGDGAGSEAADGGAVDGNHDDFVSEFDLRADTEQSFPSANRNQKAALSAV